MRSWRDFIAGAVCGALVMAAGAGAWVWWGPVHSAQDAAIYDECLAEGKTVIACDALVRMRAREAAAEADVKRLFETLLAAGFSKCEVVKWARDKGAASIHISAAMGIPVKDLDDGC